MTIDKATVRKLGTLSRIDVSAEDEDYYATQVGNILKWIEQLQEVNTDGIEPLTSVSSIVPYQRPDVVNDGDKVTDVLANAPESVEGFFVVSKIVE